MKIREEMRSRHSFDLAVQACRKISGCALDWTELPDEHGAKWQSQTIEPEVARVAA